MRVRLLASFGLVVLAAVLAACEEEGPDCSLGAEYHVPGCGDEMYPALEVAGCYAPCNQEGAECDGAGTCRSVTINPCPCESGEPCCDACGEVVRICVP